TNYWFSCQINHRMTAIDLFLPITTFSRITTYPAQILFCLMSATREGNNLCPFRHQLTGKIVADKTRCPGNEDLFGSHQHLLTIFSYQQHASTLAEKSGSHAPLPNDDSRKRSVLI